MPQNLFSEQLTLKRIDMLVLKYEIRTELILTENSIICEPSLNMMSFLFQKKNLTGKYSINQDIWFEILNRQEGVYLGLT